MITVEQNENLTVFDLRAAYQKLYKFMMQYLWDFDTVELLANIEIEIFKAFPDVNRLKKLTSDLEREISDVFTEDTAEFKSAHDALKSLVDSYDDSGYELYSVNALVDIPELSDDSSTEKVKYKIGDIIKEEHSDENSEE